MSGGFLSLYPQPPWQPAAHRAALAPAPAPVALVQALAQGPLSRGSGQVRRESLSPESSKSLVGRKAPKQKVIIANIVCRLCWCFPCVFSSSSIGGCPFGRMHRRPSLSRSLWTSKDRKIGESVRWSQKSS